MTAKLIWTNVKAKILSWLADLQRFAVNLRLQSPKILLTAEKRTQLLALLNRQSLEQVSRRQFTRLQAVLTRERLNQLARLVRLQDVSRRGRIRLAIIGGVTFALLLFFTFVPSFLLYYATMAGLERLGMSQVTLKTAEVGLIGGRVQLQKLDAKPPEGPGSSLENFQVTFGWRPLLSRRLVVEKLSLSGARIEIERKADGNFIISGLPIPTSPTDSASTETEETTPWGVGIEDMELTDGQLIYREGDVEIVFALQKLALSQLRSWEANTAAKLDLQATLNGALFAVVGDLKLFAADKQSVSLNVNINELDLGRLAPLLQLKDVTQAGGLLVAKASIDADVYPDYTFRTHIDGDIGLDKTKVVTPTVEAAFQKSLLAGKIDITEKTLGLDATLTFQNLDAASGDTRTELNLIKFNLKPMHFRLDTGKSHLDWDGGIELEQVEAALPDTVAKLTKAAWKGKIDGVLSDEPTLMAMGRISVEDFSGQLPENEANIQSLQLDLHPLKLDVPKDQGLGITGAAKLKLVALKASMPNLQASNDSIEWDGKFTIGLKDGPKLDSSGALKLTGLKVEQEGLATELGEFSVTHQPLTYRQEPSGQQTVGWAGMVGFAAAKIAMKDILATQDTFAFNGQANINLVANSSPSGQISGSINLGKTRADLAQLALWVEQESGQIDTKIELSSAQPDAIKIDAGIELTTLAAGSSKSQIDLARVEKISIKDFALNPQGRLSAEQLTVNNLKMLQRSGEDEKSYPWRLELGTLEAIRFVRRPNGNMGLDRLALGGLVARLVRLPNGFLGLDDVPGVEPAAAAAAENPKEAEAPKAPPKKQNPKGRKAQSTPANSSSPSGPRIRLKQVELGGDSRILFEDRTFKSPFRLEAKPVTAKITDIDTTASNRPIGVDIGIGVGQYGSVKASGSVQPFDPKLSADMKVEIKQFDLPPFSTYAADAVGINILTGQLNSTTNVKIVREIITGEVKAQFANLFLDEREGQDNLLSKEAGLPIDTALGLLRDEDGNIDLGIPLGGNLSDPQFDVSSVISKAIGSAVRSAAATTLKIIFPPALLISAVSSSSSGPAIKPLEFAPGQSALTPAHEEQLRLISDLMKQRPSLRINLCGVGTRRDWQAISPPPAPNKNRSEQKTAAAAAPSSPAPEETTEIKPTEETPKENNVNPTLPNVDAGKLEELAHLRSDRAKEFLTSRYEIAANRIFECRSSVQLSPTALPRIDIRL